MEKSDAIRRAVRHNPVPELSSDFTGRLMSRIQRESKRRERRETWLLATGGIGCFGALIATCWWILFRWMNIELQKPRLNLQLFDMSLFSEEKSQLLGYGFIALAALVLLIADLLIRRRITATHRT